RIKTSTLLPGFHKYPNFYACYLLRSYHNGKMSQRTYVGSIPDPPRRFWQHNGQLKGGAVRTKYHWHWEMELICFRFPSKLVALQFEWVWNTPYKSRNLQIKRPVNSGSIHVSQIKPVKLKILRKMMSIKPWSFYPLKIIFFEEKTAATTANLRNAFFVADFLTYVCCLSPTCFITSHLFCLSKYYLEQDSSHSFNADKEGISYKCQQIVPDCGSCPACYTKARLGELIQ
ncbi:hypothetical protein BY996DRAFT_4569759, partial [Phakopsora pachyrhizi]